MRSRSTWPPAEAAPNPGSFHRPVGRFTRAPAVGGHDIAASSGLVDEKKKVDDESRFVAARSQGWMDSGGM